MQGLLRLKFSVQHLFCLDFDKKDKKTLLFTFVGKDVSNVSLTFEKPALATDVRDYYLFKKKQFFSSQKAKLEIHILNYLSAN